MNNEIINEKQEFTFKGQVISHGKRMTPLKGIVYGDNGVGKTTLFSSSLKPIIVDMEGNCSHISSPCCRITKYDDFMALITSLLANEHEYKTLVIDSLDSLQTFILERMSQQHTTQELSYGKSNAILAKHIKEIVGVLEALQNKKNMNVLFTAHWKVKTANNPMVDQYDRYDMRINEEMRTGFCNWVQFIFLALKEVVFDENKDAVFGKKKVKGMERRVLYTAGDPTYYGKNVFNFPPKMMMDWTEITKNVKKFYDN